MDIINHLTTKGIEEIVFLVPMKPIQTVFGFFAYTSSSDPDILMLCKVVEDRYKVKDGYKLTLESIKQIPGLCGRQHFYISDLEKLIDEGSVKVFEKIS